MFYISLFGDNEYTDIEGNQIPFDDAHDVLQKAKQFVARCISNPILGWCMETPSPRLLPTTNLNKVGT
jgi:hypothetical protein